MKRLSLWVLAIVLTGCGITYINAPRDIRVTSPDAKVVLTDSDTENFSTTATESTTTNTTKE